ncbi:MAG: GNAT family N-acetyltransferase [Oscillospiraceae bacterium]|nr:GNAT family N-acetyltransferase [Oscillospiraceae bacterium]
MEMIIRKADICDIPDLIKLNDEFNGPGVTLDWMKDSLMNSKNEVVFIAAVNDMVVGFICGIFWQSICYAEGFQGIIMELFVNEKYRRKGLATKLVQALEKEFVNLNVSEVTLVTPITNTIGRYFYENCGYSDEKEMKYRKLL